MGELVREEIAVEAFDVPGDRELRLFFLLPETFVAEATLAEDDDGGPIGVALYRRVIRATEPGEHDESDAAFLVVGTLTFALREPWADRPVVRLGSAAPVATLAGAGRRNAYGQELLRAAEGRSLRWRRADDEPPVATMSGGDEAPRVQGAPTPAPSPEPRSVLDLLRVDAPFDPRQGRALVHRLGRWLDAVVPDGVRVASDKDLYLQLWSGTAPRTRRAVDLGVLAEVDSWEEAGEQLWFLFEEELPDAVAALGGRPFPDPPATKRCGPGGASPFVRLRDGALECGWRREDGWQLSMDPVAIGHASAADRPAAP
ncbi:hypothetical protein [Patulibacter americanus]|uniref:hypothetical protein n=1 Tax=Patulibacter americanus TaxID=588672 RepID=UPI0003B4D3E5|nr:hypothetical protein [Patulibacter americanus]